MESGAGVARCVCVCDTFWYMTGLLWEMQSRYRKGGRIKI